MAPQSSKTQLRQDELNFRQSFRHEWLFAVGRDPCFAKHPSVVRAAIMLWHRWFAQNQDAAISYNQLAAYLAGVATVSDDPVGRRLQEKAISAQKPTAVRAIKALTDRGWLRLTGRRGRLGENRYELENGPDKIWLGKRAIRPVTVQEKGGSSTATPGVAQ